MRSDTSLWVLYYLPANENHNFKTKGGSRNNQIQDFQPATDPLEDVKSIYLVILEQNKRTEWKIWEYITGRNLCFQLRVGMFECVLAHNVKYISYYDQGQESRKPLIVPISPYHKKGCGVGKKTFGPEKVNDSLKFIGHKWQTLEL